MLRSCVFLDRDDTLIPCRSVAPGGDLGDPALVRLPPGVEAGCRRLRDAGFALVVVSNQGGVARGKHSEAAVHAVNRRVNALLGGAIERFYFCPFHPRGVDPEFTREHPWRKPSPGMLQAAAADLDLDLPRCWMVGDSERDAQAAAAAGCRSIRVPTLGASAPDAACADFLADDFAGAVAIILRESAQRMS